MKRIFLLYCSAVLSICLHSQAGSRFSFGNGHAVKGYLPVTPQTLFNHKLGYGFDSAAAVKAIVNDNKGGLNGAYITSDRPFYFSVELPEGNYDVKLLLGDTKGYAATTVRAECRRLLLENIRTPYGKTITSTITVHVRDSLIRNAAGDSISKIRLKPREHAFLHWDNMLTLEFNDSLPKICALEITPNRKATTIFLAGNSTVVDQDREPWAAWGQMLPAFIASGKAVVANYAESGETLKAFKAEKRLDKIWSMAKPGDYLLIEFAHNDQKPGGNHLDAFTTYKETLKEWIVAARQRNIIPMLVTSMHRRSFDSSGHIINTLFGYPEAMRQTAREMHVSLIDLNAMSKILYEAWGEAQSIKAFVHYTANTFPGQPQALKDDTHFNTYGAYELARCVIGSIQKQHLPLEKFLKKGIPAFDPAKPSLAANFYWPQSRHLSAAGPDGN